MSSQRSQDVEAEYYHGLRLNGKPLANLALLNQHAWTAACNGTTVKLWDFASGSRLASFTGDNELESCIVSPDDALIVIGTSSGQIHLLAIEF